MKTNYFLKSAAMMVLCLLSFQLNAQTVVDGIAYNIIDNGAAAEVAPLAVDKDGNATAFYNQASITIPANVTIGGKSYPVTTIGRNSLRQNNNLTSLTLSEGLVVIGNSSLAQCENLPEIKFPSTVKTIDVWAFYGCKSLTSIEIPEGVSMITEHTFQSTGITTVKLPASVKTLDVCAFQSSPVETINLENVEVVKGWALAQTNVKSVVSSKMTNIAEVSFYECIELEEVDFPNVVAIGGSSAFKGCVKLHSVNLDKSANTGGEAFNGCVALKNVKMGSLVNIGDWAFAGCKSLETLTIPNTVVIVGSWSLEKTGLKEIFISWDEDALNELYIGENAFGVDEGKSEFVWKVPANLKDLYGDEWEDYPVEVGASSIINTEADQINVFYANGSLNLINLEGQQVSVIALDGRVLATFYVDGAVSEIAVELNSGVYVLRANNTSAKFIVK